MSDLLTVTEAAERVRVSPETIRNWLKDGYLKGTRLPGGDYRVNSEDLERILKQPVVPEVKG
jgi:excisionase family DNA binding protein